MRTNRQHPRHKTSTALTSASSSSSSPSPTQSPTRSVPSSPPRPSPAVLKEAAASLSAILPNPLPDSLLSEPTLTLLLQDPAVTGQISALLFQPSSGSGDDPLCCWLYNTLQVSPSGSPPPLLPIVLCHLPSFLLLYLSRPSPSPGFEAVLIAVYSHVQAVRANQPPLRVSIPDLSHPSIYQEEFICEPAGKSIATPVSLAVLSPNLEPYGTVRSTRQARIVGVALELYFSRVSEMPTESKLDFCKLCDAFSSSILGDNEAREVTRSTKVTLQREILQQMLRILGYCLMGPNNEKPVVGLYTTALHGVDAKAIFATGSLIELFKIKCKEEECGEFDDPTEIPKSDIIIIN
ncbi:hypothetical protein MLD38_008185 [Melastoma candidum]|uniref:Uncharacterized protein n=1 Tax=Melastoma candidum TaxID=119954 RepID=A0ACB9RU23_9MYRT|nr:hypothetical protein MLD38_008185 [Melastoma candidum]